MMERCVEILNEVCKYFLEYVNVPSSNVFLL